MWKTCLGKQQAFLLSYQNDQFAGEKPSLKEAHTILALRNLGGFIFSSYSPANHSPSTACVSDMGTRLSLPAERALRDRVFAQCGFLRSASTKARLAALFHWNHFFPFNSFLFSESICYGFSSAAYLWPHANFHKRAFFVLNRMQWCLPLPSKRAVWIWSQVQKREDGGEKGRSCSSM